MDFALLQQRDYQRIALSDEAKSLSSRGNRVGAGQHPGAERSHSLEQHNITSLQPTHYLGVVGRSAYVDHGEQAHVRARRPCTEPMICSSDADYAAFDELHITS